MHADEGQTLDFGPLLRSFRLARGISQEVLAERSRLSVQGISSLERGARRSPYRHTVNSLADALGLDADQRAMLARAAAQPRGPRTVHRRSGNSHFPAYATAFIGRTRECLELAALMERSRLVVVSGFGGVGKTRLGIEVVTRYMPRSSESYFVDFSTLRDPQLVISRIAAIFRLAPVPCARDLESVTAALASRDLVLVLDNCESVIDECARVVDAIIRGCPRARILATSREPLRIDGETLYRLESLDPVTSAIELFVDRFVTSRAGGGEVPDPAAAAAIVRRLDGIPLAIELAAGLAHTRSLDDILASLASDEFLTIAERRSAVGHHRTMRAAIEWSYDALSAGERTDLRMLAYPPAGTTRAGALAVCAREDDRNLRRLVDTSLIIEDRTTGRLRLHEVTHQFVASFDLASETAEAAERYARYLGTQMRAAFERGWEPSSGDPLEHFVPLIAELDNVRAAFRYALATGNHSLALDLAAGPDYWTAVGRVPEGYEWLERVSDAGGDADDDPRSATLLFGLTLCAIQSGRPGRAFEFAKRAADLAARHGLALIGGRALITMGHVLLARGDAHSALDWFERAAARFIAIGNETAVARARVFMAFALIELGEVDAAERIVGDLAHRQRKRHGPPASPEWCFIEILLSDVARLRGELALRREHGRAALAFFAGGPITSMYARAVHGLVEALVLSGQLDEAQNVAAAELRDFEERGFHTEVALLLEICAALWLRRNEPVRAARIAYFADTLLSSAKRTRMRFAAALYRDVHQELDALLSASVRKDLAEAAGRDRIADVVALAATEIEVYD